MIGSHDPALAKLEDELRASRTQAWDVETFLANRHQAKIDALTAPGSTAWSRRWETAKGLTALLLMVIGYLTVGCVIFGWLIAGEFPIHRGLFDHDAAYHRVIENPVPPPLASPR